MPDNNYGVRVKNRVGGHWRSILSQVSSEEAFAFYKEKGQWTAGKKRWLSVFRGHTKLTQNWNENQRWEFD